METVLKFTVSFLGLLYNKAANYLQNLGRHAVIVAALSTVLLVISGLASMTSWLGWLVMLCWIGTGLALSSLFIFALPILWTLKEATERSKGLRWAIMLPVMVLFFFTLAGRFFSIIPTYQNPKMIVQAMAIAFMLALVLSFAATLHRKVLACVLMFWFVGTSATFVWPETTSLLLEFGSDKKLARGLKKIPYHVEYNPNMRPYDPLSGESRYWFCSVDNEMYDAPGRCENHQGVVLLAMNDKIWEIHRRNYLARQEEKKRQEEKQRIEEKAKQEEAEREREKQIKRQNDQEIENLRQEMAKLKYEKETQALPLFVPSSSSRPAPVIYQPAPSRAMDAPDPDIEQEERLSENLLIVSRNTPIIVGFHNDLTLKKRDLPKIFDGYIAERLIVNDRIVLGEGSRVEIEGSYRSNIVNTIFTLELRSVKLDGRSKNLRTARLDFEPNHRGGNEVKSAAKRIIGDVVRDTLGIYEKPRLRRAGEDEDVLKISAGETLIFRTLGDWRP